MPTASRALAPAQPSVPMRLAVAAAIALAAGVIAWYKGRMGGFGADFAYFWSAGRALLDGANPYTTIEPVYVYPLPAAVAIAAIAWLPMGTAAILFVGASVGALAFVLTREGWHRLPILMSFPTLWSMSSGQWAPLVACAALSSGFAWAAVCKPTLGAAMFLSRPTLRGAIVAAVFVLVSFLFLPRWPFEWLNAARTFSGEALHHVPVLIPGGALLLLAAMRWRRPDARLLLGMALVPQSMFAYDQLALGLLATTRLQAIVWGLWSYAVMVTAFVLTPSDLADGKVATANYLARAIVWGYYLPALVVVLRRPNVAADPAPAAVPAHDVAHPAMAEDR